MAAANTESLVRPLPSNQTSTMMAYPAPNYPMPRAALAIRNAMRPNAPRPIDPNGGGYAPVPMGDPQGGAPGGVGTMDAGPGDDWSAQFQNWGTPNNGIGPTTQTASGGVIEPEAAPDLTTPEGWQAFRLQHNPRAGVATGAVPPKPAPLMQPNRLGSSMVPAYRPRTNS